MISRMCTIAIVVASALASNQALAAIIYDAGALEFESTGQSMWAPGSALRQSDSVFLGAQWTNKTATIGGIAGSANEVIIPAIGAVTAPVYEPTIWVPTPTWSDPFKGYWTGCGCWKNVTITPAIGAVTIDSRTGAKLDVTSSGKVGLEFGYSIDSGSVDTTASFDAMAELPDVVNAGELFSIDTTSIFDSGTIATQSPKAEAYISAIMQLSGSSLRPPVR